METGKETSEPLAFGMSEKEIIAAADELCGQKDTNHPTETGSYSGFIKTLQAGREAFADQKTAK